MREPQREATVSPVASGGYFWAFFDSVRAYGNLGIQHQLWGTAIELRPDGNYTTDPSHPAQSSDCCNSANLCVNGFCAQVELL